MPTLRFTKDNLPPRDELTRTMKELRERSTPVDDLLVLVQEMKCFEQKYGLTTQEFFLKYRMGEIEDDMDFIEWAGRYRLYLDLKEKIEISLEKVIAT